MKLIIISLIILLRANVSLFFARIDFYPSIDSSLNDIEFIFAITELKIGSGNSVYYSSCSHVSEFY